MKYSLAELYVLRKGDRGLEYGFHDKLRASGYDFKNEILSKKIKKLTDNEKVKFIGDIEKFIDKLDIKKDKKLFMLLIVIFSSLSCVIDIKKEPIYSEVLKIAKRLVNEYSEPGLIIEIVDRHGGIDLKKIY